MATPNPDSGMMAKSCDFEMVSTALEALKQGTLRFLRFPDPLEAAFNEYYAANTLKHLRVALWTGLFLYASFGLVDLMLLPSDRAHMWFIRYALVCPTVTAGILFTYADRLKRFRQLAITLVMLVGSLGIVGMVYFDPTPAKNYYYSGILLLIMGGFTFVSMRLSYAVSWALMTTAAYEMVAVFANHTDPSILIQNTFSIISTIIIGSFSNYLMEKYLRQDFLNSLLLEHENRELQRAGQELHRLSMSDELTGLGNRRHFERMLDQEWSRASRSGTPVSLLLFDIDFFKRFNDNYGHRAGDECLRLVADTIGTFARRPGDAAARYGGEEFALLLPTVDPASAVTVAEACRKAVESLRISHGYSDVRNVVTISAGVSTMIPDIITDRRSLVEVADEALYRAKREGRNRVAEGTQASAFKEHPDDCAASAERCRPDDQYGRQNTSIPSATMP